MNDSLQHIDINNYETWFLLFADGALTDTQKQMVTGFINKHPHLKKELDDLVKTISPVETSIIFNPKHSLLKLDEETMLLYLDKELSNDEQHEVESILDNDLQKQMNDLKKAYNQPDAAIVFENKEKLYRQLKVVKIIPAWLKVAAAAVLVGIVFTVYKVISSNKINELPVAARGQINIPQLPAITDSDRLLSGQKQEQVALSQPQIKNNKRLNKEDEPDVAYQTIARKQIKSSLSTNQNKEGPSVEKNNPGIAVATAPSVTPVVNNNVNLLPEQKVQSVNEVTSNLHITTNQNIAVNNRQNPETEKKKKSFFKAIGDGIKNRALDVLTNGGDDVTVGVFAVNISR